MSHFENMADQRPETELVPWAPTLPNDHGPETFKADPDVIILHYRTWMEEARLLEGRVVDIWTDTRPFALRMPRGVFFQDMIAKTIAESGGEVDEEYLRTDPNPEPLRRAMQEDPELRTRMPSPGFVNVRTRQDHDNPTGLIIGVDMNNIGLIPRAVFPSLVEDGAHRESWLVNGGESWNGERDTLRQALTRGVIDEDERGVYVRAATAHSQKRARRHARNVSGRVGKHYDTSMDTFSADRV